MPGKNAIRRGISLLLTVILCLSFLPATGVSATETIEERQQAVVATGLAFYDKGQAVQYDSATLNPVKKGYGGATRTTNECGPEFATEKETVYSVCSDFCYLAYYFAYGYRLCGKQGSCWTAALANPKYIKADDPRLIYRYNIKTGLLEDMPDEKVAEYGQPADYNAAFAKMVELAQPGDIITEINTESNSSGGHSVLFVGDVKGTGKPYCLHCYGGKLHMSGSGDDSGDDSETNDALGRDTVEIPYSAYSAMSDAEKVGFIGYSDANGGAIRLSTVNAWLKSNAKTKARLTLLRPLNTIDAAEYPILAAARTRMNYPRLSIDRTTDKSRFNATRNGDTLHLYLKLKNSSDAAYTLPVTERIPAGTALLSCPDGCTVSGDTIYKSVSLAAGEEKTLTFSYRITAAMGAEVVFGDGAVGGIPSNRICVAVGGAELPAAKKALLADIANGTYDAVLAGATDATLGKVVYEDILGIRGVEFPAYTDVAEKLMRPVTLAPQTGSANVTVLTFRDAVEDRFLESMTAPDFFGGKDFWVAESDRRVLDTKASYIEPGDIVVRLNDGFAPTASRTMVCIAEGQYVQLNADTGAPEIVTQKELVKSHLYGLFYALRPTRAYATLSLDPGAVKSMSLSLNDLTAINYYLSDPEGSYTDDSYALVDGERVPMTKEGTDWYLPVRESVAKEMCRVSAVQAVGVDAGGTEHAATQNTLSVRSYAMQLLGGIDWTDDRDAKLGCAMIGLLDYGAEAQKFFDWETDDLANRYVDAADRAKMTCTPASIAESRRNTRAVSDAQGLYYASSCALGSSMALRFYLNLPESRADRESLGFTARYKNYNGEIRTVTKSFAELTESTASGIYCFEVSGMAAADVKTDVTLTVAQAGSTVASVTDSIASYCARVYSSTPAARDLTDAVLIYGLSARAYFFRPVPDPGENELPIA